MYDKKADEYVLVGRRQTLKAGSKQTISMTFSEQMGEVYGLLNGRRIPFKCVNPEEHQQVWTAEFDVPKFHEVGPEKFLRVYATDLARTVYGFVDAARRGWEVSRNPGGELRAI